MRKMRHWDSPKTASTAKDRPPCEGWSPNSSGAACATGSREGGGRPSTSPVSSLNHRGAAARAAASGSCGGGPSAGMAVPEPPRVSAAPPVDALTRSRAPRRRRPPPARASASRSDCRPRCVQAPGLADRRPRSRGPAQQAPLGRIRSHLGGWAGACEIGPQASICPRPPRSGPAGTSWRCDAQATARDRSTSSTKREPT